MSPLSAAKKPSAYLLVMVAVALAFASWSAFFIWRTSIVAIDGRRYFSLFDDAMVSMRYAWNLAHGAGPVWNPGERVEGYTSPLSVLVMTIFCLVLDKRLAVLAVQILGVPTVIATAAVTVRIYRLVSGNSHQPSSPAQVSWLVFGGVFAYYPLAYFALMGMETGLLAMLLSLAAYLAILASRAPQRRLFVLLGLVGGLMFLARPDAALFVALIICYTYVRSKQMGLHGKQSWAGPVLVLVIFLALVVCARLSAYLYYGQLLPNTYLLKLTRFPLSVRLVGGLKFISPYLAQTFPLIALCLLEVLFDARLDKLLLGVVPTAAVVYQVWVGGDPWHYWRIMASSYPLLLVMAITAAEALARVALRAGSAAEYFYRRPLFSPAGMLPLLTTIALLPGLYLANRSFADEILGADWPYQVVANSENVDIAIALQDITAADATIGVFWAGALPYYSGRHAVDFLGKSDPYVAALPADLSGPSSVPGHNKHDLNYSIRTLMPTYVQGFIWGSQDLTEWGFQQYSSVDYKGVDLLLKNGSPQVLWSRLDLAGTP